MTPIKRARWQFWIPLMIQTALIIAIPLQSAVIYSTGRAVTLKTAPVDPYDFLRGYSQKLRYDISRLDMLKTLPGGKEIFPDRYNSKPTTFYIVLQAPATDTSPPSDWAPVRVSRDRPQSLPENQVALKGDSQGWRVQYGLETYYMPAKQRDRINEEIREVQRNEDQAFLVDIKVDAQGKSVPVSLWVGDHKYQF